MPYKGSEDWVDQLEGMQVLTSTEAWRPWYATSGKGRYAPAGYATMYTPTAAPKRSFGFVTIRLAGHMVPTFQPEAALAFIARFFRGEAF